MLRTNQVEFALATMLTEVPDLEFVPLVADVFCVVYPAYYPAAAIETLGWKELVPHDLVLSSQGSSAAASLIARLRRTTRWLDCDTTSPT